jgi:hypothetical protein
MSPTGDSTVHAPATTIAHPTRVRWAGAGMLLAVVVVGALAQALTAGPALGSVAVGWTVLLAIVSFCVLVAQLALATGAARILVTGTATGTVSSTGTATGTGTGSSSVRWARLWLLSAVCAVVLVAAAVLFVAAVPLVLLLVAIILSGAADGARAPLGGFAAYRVHPWRAATASVVSLLVVGIGWVVAVSAGLFLTGVVGGVVMWVWFGLSAAALLVWWARLQPR